MASTGRPMRYLRTPASCGQNLRYRWPGLRTWNRCLACLLVRAAALFVRLLLALCGLLAHHNQSIHLWGARQGKAFLHRRLTTVSFFLSFFFKELLTLKFSPRVIYFRRRAVDRVRVRACHFPPNTSYLSIYCLGSIWLTSTTTLQTSVTIETELNRRAGVSVNKRPTTKYAWKDTRQGTCQRREQQQQQQQQNEGQGKEGRG